MSARRADRPPRRLSATALLDLAVHSNGLIAVYAAALSGFLSLGVHAEMDWLGVSAVLLLSWQVYTVDRLARPKEDLAGDEDRLRFVDRHSHVLRGILLMTVLVEAALVWTRPMLLVALSAGGALGALYLVRIPLLRRRLKDLPFIKSFYVPLVHLTTYLLALRAVPRTSEHVWLIAGVYVLLTLNAIAFDIKDRNNDRAAGIRTFANRVPVTTLVPVLQLAALLAATALLLQGGSAPRVLALVYGCFALFVHRLLSETPRRYFFVVLDGVLAQPLGVLLLADAQHPG